jgi:hypothetical protein
MDSDVTNSVSKQSIDVSWPKFIAVALAMDLVAFLFDEIYRPMRGVDQTEMVLWYLGYGIGFAAIPAVIVVPFVVVSKLKGKNTGKPKLTILSWGIGLLAFNLVMNAIRLS